MLLEHLVDDGAGAADRLAAVVDGAGRLDGAHAMVVDDLHDLGLADAVDHLGELGMVDEDDVLLVDVDHVGRAHDTRIAAVLVDDGEEAVPGALHDALGVFDGGVHREVVDLCGRYHLGTHGNRHRDEAGGRIGVVWRGDDRAVAVAREVAKDAGDVGAAADDEASRAALKCEALRLVAVGDQDHVARGHEAVHHLGCGANRELAHLDVVLGVARDHVAVERVEDVGVARAGAGEREVVEYVHVGVGDVAQGDQALQVALLVGHAQRGAHLVAHEIPRDMQAGLPVHADERRDVDVLDLGRDARDEARLLETEVLEGIGGLTVDGAGTPCLVTTVRPLASIRPIDLVLEVGVADGSADAVRIRVKVTYDVHLAN